MLRTNDHCKKQKNCADTCDNIAPEHTDVVALSTWNSQTMKTEDPMLTFFPGLQKLEIGARVELLNMDTNLQTPDPLELPKVKDKKEAFMTLCLMALRVGFRERAGYFSSGTIARNEFKKGVEHMQKVWDASKDGTVVFKVVRHIPIYTEATEMQERKSQTNHGAKRFLGAKVRRDPTASVDIRKCDQYLDRSQEPPRPWLVGNSGASKLDESLEEGAGEITEVTNAVPAITEVEMKGIKDFQTIKQKEEANEVDAWTSDPIEESATWAPRQLWRRIWYASTGGKTVPPNWWATVKTVPGLSESPDKKGQQETTYSIPLQCLQPIPLSPEQLEAEVGWPFKDLPATYWNVDNKGQLGIGLTSGLSWPLAASAGVMIAPEGEKGAAGALPASVACLVRANPKPLGKNSGTVEGLDSAGMPRNCVKINRSPWEYARHTARKIIHKIDVRTIMRDKVWPFLLSILDQGVPVPKGAQIATSDCIAGLSFDEFFDLYLPMIFATIPVPGLPSIGVVVAQAAKMVFMGYFLDKLMHDPDFANMLYSRYKMIILEVFL